MGKQRCIQSGCYSRNGKIFMLYRAEDTIGKYAGTSRLGLAESNDGLHFTRHPEPYFFPTMMNKKNLNGKVAAKIPVWYRMKMEHIYSLIPHMMEIRQD